MEDIIQAELVKLQEELNKLDTAAKMIENAGEISTNVIDSVKGVQKEYGEYLKKIAAKYEEYLDNSRIYTAEKVNELSDLHKNQMQASNEILDKYKTLAEAAAKLPEQIEGVDFPMKLSKIENSLKNFTQEFSDSKQIIESLKVNLVDEQNKSIELQEKLNQQGKQISSLKLISIISLIVMIGIFAMTILPVVMK